MSLPSHHNPYKSDSDDEDEDYVPPDDNKNESDSEPSDDEKSPKGVGDTDVLPTSEDPEAKKRARDALWAEFQASAAGPSKHTNGQPLQPPRMVKIERKYRFAGEDVIEVVEVPEDSPEAKKWPLWKDPTLTVEETTDASTSSIPPLTQQDQTSPTPAETDTAPPTSSSSSNAIAKASTTTTSHPSPPPPAPKPPPKKPGPRKPKTALAPLPGPTKVKKLTTLDKSAMDWQRHIQTEQQAGPGGSSLKDELEANRRAGGYLEKVEFLKRVEERKEENLDAVRGSKRRRL